MVSCKKFTGGKTNQSYQESTGHGTNDRPVQHLSGSDCLHRGSNYPLESRNRLTLVGKASSKSREPFSTGSPSEMNQREPLLSGSPGSVMNSKCELISAGSPDGMSCKNNYSSNQIVVNKNTSV